MPCSGCGKKDMNEYQGRLKMKFVGKPNGVFLKGAPGSYTQGQIYEVPASYIGSKYWELVDPPPILKVPSAELEDSVFENSVFVPPDFDDATKQEAVTSSHIENTQSTPSHSNESSMAIEAPVEPINENDIRPLDDSPIEILLESVKKRKKAKPGDTIPPEIRAELETLGDGVIDEGDEEEDESAPEKTEE